MWLSCDFGDQEIALDYMCGPTAITQEGHSQAEGSMMTEAEGQSDAQKGSQNKECKWHPETIKSKIMKPP